MRKKPAATTASNASAPTIDLTGRDRIEISRPGYHNRPSPMNLLLIPKVAFRAIVQNAMRSALTALGIIIGVAAVICVVAIGEGASIRVEQAITNIGANMVWIEAGGVNRNGVRTGAYGTKTLTLADYDAIREHVTLVTNVTPQADTRVQLVYGNQNWSSSVRGVAPAYPDLKRLNVPA